MAIQWSSSLWNTMSQRDVLAGVIQGEAKGAAGQFAVSSVIQNRLDSVGSGYVGYGTGNLQSVVTPSQFNGWQPPTAQSYQYADAILNGNLSQYGNTGNATFYAAPSYSNAAWANPGTASGQGLFGAGNNNVAGNYYSNNLGPPTSGFQAPQYGNPQTDAQQDAAQDSGAGWSDSAFTPDSGQTYTASNGAAAAGPTASDLGIGTIGNSQAPFNPVTAQNPGQVGSGLDNFGYNPNAVGGEGTYTSLNPLDGYNANESSAASNAPGLYAANQPSYDIGSGTVGTNASTAAGAVTPQTVAPASLANSTATAANDAGGYAGDMFVPPALDTVARSIGDAANTNAKTTASAAQSVTGGLNNVGSQISTGAKTTAAATQALAQTVASSTTQATATAQDIKTTLFAFTSNIFVRAAIIGLGLIFVAAALHMFASTGNTIADPVVTAKRVGRGIKKGAVRTAAVAA